MHDAVYCIAGNVDGGGNFEVFDAFQPDRQNLTHQIFKAIQCLVKDSDHPSKYFCQIFEKLASVKISPVKISLYTVLVILQNSQ